MFLLQRPWWEIDPPWPSQSDTQDLFYWILYYHRHHHHWFSYFSGLSSELPSQLLCIQCWSREEQLQSLSLSTIAGSCFTISLLAQCEMTKSLAQTTHDRSNLSPVIWTISGQTVIVTAKTLKLSSRACKQAGGQEVGCFSQIQLWSQWKF